MKRSLLFLIGGILLSATSQAQVFVTPSGAGTHSGISWANAASGNTLRNIVGTSSFGTEVWVAAGTYKPSVASRDSSFAIASGVQVYGGFAGTETTRYMRDWATNVTILSGDVGVTGEDTDNARHVVYFEYADTSTTLDGFTIEHGYATVGTSTLYNSYFGGGILNYGPISNPYIHNCTIRNNYAEGTGGGMAEYNPYGTMHSRVVNCVFSNNVTDDGIGRGDGALAFYTNSGFLPGDTTNVTSMVDSCTITGSNKSGISLLAADAHMSPTISNTLVRGNNGIGIKILSTMMFYGGGVDVHIKNCHIIHNHLFSNGSAVNVLISQGWRSSIVIENSLIDSNTSGLQFITEQTDSVYWRVSGCRFSNNQDVLGMPNAIVKQTGSNYTDSLFVDNCVFSNTTADYEGSLPDVALESGGLNGHTYVNFDNCTFYKILSPPGSYLGSHIFLHTYSSTASTNTANIKITNSIFYCSDPLYTPISTLGPMSTIAMTTKKSIMAGTGGSGGGWTSYGTDGGGNLDLYPQFMDTAAHDLHLKCTSPAVNAGNNALVPTYTTTDIDGNARIRYATVDMGAYEKDTTGCAMLPLAVADPAVQEVALSPNPALTSFTISLPAGESNASVSLYDITGKAVFNAEHRGASTVVPVSTLNDGLYLCKVITGKGTYLKKVVVAH